MYQSQGQPIDWTSGTGVFPAGGAIVIPANANRHFFYVVNMDTTGVSVAIGAAKATDETPTTSVLPLAPASVSGQPGGLLDRHLMNYVPVTAITVTGTPGKQVVVLEG